MTPERRQLVEAIFLEAAELPADARRELLAARCGDDNEVRREVESLLGVHEEDHGILDEPQPMTQGLMQQISGLLRAGDASIPASGRIGAYRIIRVLGSGGMGVVYLAEQERPKRTVALKVIRRGLATPSLLRRFEHEAEILGRLHHPGIAQIYEAGVADDGSGPQPYIAMEFIDGRPLNEHVIASKLGAREKLALMVRVCEAVQHAHQRGVIHRDLKPGNILVQQGDAMPSLPKSDTPGTTLALGVCQPKVLDFGVARLADERLGVTTMGTNIGQLVGTVAYMSPEQLVGDVRDIDVRSDVYALGVVLFQLLTGKLPYDLTNRMLPEIVRMIKEDPPARVGSLSRECRGDLETIVSKAIEKQRSRRYQSAADLGADIHRFLLGEAIAAKRDSALYVVGMQLKRYKWVVATAAVFFLMLIAFAIYASYQATEKGQLALQERASKEAVLAEQEKLERTLYSARIGYAQSALASNDAERLRRELDACPDRFRGWEWNYLSRVADTSDVEIRVTPDGGGGVNLALHAGLAAACQYGISPVVRFWKIPEWQPLPSWTLDRTPNWTLLAPDGERLIAAFPESTVALYEISTRTLKWEKPYPDDSVRSYILTPDGSSLITIGSRLITIWDVQTGEVVRSFPIVGTHGQMAVSPDGSLLAVGNQNGVIVVYNLHDGAVYKRFVGHTLVARSVSFSPDGARLVSGSHDKSVRVWDLHGDKPPILLWPHTNKVWHAIFSPDGRKIISGGTDSVIRVTDIATGEVQRALVGHSNTVTALEVDPKTSDIYSVSLDFTVRYWKSWQRPETPMIRFSNGSWTIAATRDVSKLFICVNSRNIGVIDTTTLRAVAELKLHSGFVRSLAVARDGKRLFSVANDGMLIEWDLETRQVHRATLAHDGAIFRVVLTPDESAVVTAGADGLVKFWDPVDGSLRRTMTANKDGVIALAFSPDGMRLATGGFDRTVRVWDRPSGQQVAQLGGFSDYITSLQYIPGNPELLITANDGTVRSWDPTGLAASRDFIGHKRAAFCATFFPDSSRFVTGGFDNTVRLWDPATAQELLTLRGHISSVHGIIVSPDNRKIYAVSDDGRLLIWDSSPLGHRVVPLETAPTATDQPALQ